MAAGLWLVLIERVVYVREVWLVGDWKGLAMGGSLAGRSASGLVKIPALDGGKALCWGSLPGWAGRKQVWAELFPR